MSWIHRETLLQTAFGGCIKAESLSIGDVLINGKGKPVTVSGIRRSHIDVLKVNQKRGIDFWIANQGELTLKTYSETKPIQLDMFNPHSWMDSTVVNVSDIDEKHKNYYIWKLNGINYQRRPIDLNPYFMGLWLGDGSSTQPKIYTVDDEIIDWLADYAGDMRMPFVYNTQRIYFYISRRKGERINHITDCLKKSNVYNNKHIPDNYLYNTRQTRLELLAGIIDSDGYYNRKSNAFIITMSREQITKDIHTLAMSLGFYSRYRECETSMLRADGTCYKGKGYKVSIAGELSIVPTKIVRKQARQRTSTRNYLCSNWDINFKKHRKDLCYKLQFEQDNDTLLLEDLTVIKI